MEASPRAGGAEGCRAARRVSWAFTSTCGKFLTEALPQGSVRLYMTAQTEQEEGGGGVICSPGAHYFIFENNALDIFFSFFFFPSIFTEDIQWKLLQQHHRKEPGRLCLLAELILICLPRGRREMRLRGDARVVQAPGWQTRQEGDAFGSGSCMH